MYICGWKRLAHCRNHNGNLGDVFRHYGSALATSLNVLELTCRYFNITANLRLYISIFFNACMSGIILTACCTARGVVLRVKNEDDNNLGTR